MSLYQMLQERSICIPDPELFRGEIEIGLFQGPVAVNRWSLISSSQATRCEYRAISEYHDTVPNGHRFATPAELISVAVERAELFQTGVIALAPIADHPDDAIVCTVVHGVMVVKIVYIGNGVPGEYSVMIVSA